MAFFEKMREKRWREQTRQELSHNASWSHFIYGKHWLCPYCEKLAVEDAKGSAELVDLVLEHLINCPQWKEFEGRVRPSPYLAEIVRKAEITRQLKNNPAWRLRDSEGRWYCPYCARETEVVFNSNKITKEVLGNIINHLHRCFAYDHGNGQIQPLQYVQNVLKSSERIRRLTGTVKE